MSSKAKFILIAVIIIVPVGSVFALRYFVKRDLGAVQVEAAGNRPALSAGGGMAPGGADRAGAGSGMERSRGGRNGGGGIANRAVLVDTVLVKQASINEQLSLVGALKPKESVEVVPKITGKLQRILVDVGDPVQEGQLIAELEGDELAQQVLRAEASLAVADATRAQRIAELENAEADDRRAQQLLKDGLLSRQAMESTQTRARVVQSQVTLADAQIRQAQADLAELRIRKQQTQILSPLTGWVAQRHVSVGALVNPNTPIVSVLRMSTMITEVRVPEGRLAGLRVGNRAFVSMDAMQGRTLEGKVARISPILDPATRSGSVQVEIPNPDGQLKAEMSARIQMETGSQREALLVPREAIVMRGDRPGVNLLDGDRARFQPVEIGINSPGGVEIVSGLSVGMTVITRGTQDVQDGSPVEVQSAGQGQKEQQRDGEAKPPSSDSTGSGQNIRQGARS